MANELVTMLENGIVTVAPNSQFSNEKLQGYTIRIHDLINATGRNLYEIAALFATIDNEKLYETAGFKDVQEYAQKTFGYKSSMVYKMLQVAVKFITSNETGYFSRLAHSEKDYTVSQLMELNQLEFDTVKSLDETGTITPEMTTKDIREVVKDFKNGEIDAQGQPIKFENENEAENEENDKNGEIDAVNVDIATEFNAIIEHCENLLNVAEIANNSAMKKKIDAFKKFAMKSVVNYKQAQENTSAESENVNNE